ncbi:MAG: hypothetical protein QOD82_6255, partial [Pseudonocardiales bacterium]|nr:hypothetical protein [Pseudonocardiales bacterium]
MTGYQINDLASGQLVLAAEQIEPGHHPTAQLFGLTF